MDIDLSYFENKIRSVAVRHGFNDGYQLLYCPEELLKNAKVAFISLNPGGEVADDATNIESMTDPRGNGYKAEKDTTNSPITKQFLALCEMLGVEPDDVLTGVIAPLRSRDWKDSITKDQKNAALEVGREFWEQALERNIPHIFCCGVDPANVIAKITDAKLIAEHSSGWGKTKIRVYRSPRGEHIFQLPHLSTHRIFGPKYRDRVQEVITKYYDLKTKA